MSEITVPELAEMLGLSRVTVYRWVKSGKIKARKIGHAYVITDEHVMKLLNKKITDEDKQNIANAVQKIIAEYGETLRLLGKE